MTRFFLLDKSSFCVSFFISATFIFRFAGCLAARERLHGRSLICVVGCPSEFYLTEQVEYIVTLLHTIGKLHTCGTRHDAVRARHGNIESSRLLRICRGV